MKLQELIKKEKKSQKLYLTDYNLLIAQDLWQANHHLAEGIYRIKYKYQHNDKEYGTQGIKYKDCECCLEYTNVKDNLIQMFVL